MQLKDFHLLKEHPDHYEIGHPKGRSMRVPKAGLSEKAHSLIKGLPHFDDGGPVGDEESIPVGQSAEIPSQLLNQQSQQSENNIDYGPLLAQQQAEDAPYGTTPEDQTDQATQSQSAPSNYQIQAPQRNPGSNTPFQGLPGYGEYSSGLGQAEKGLQEQADVNKQLGQQQATLEQNFQNDYQAQLADYQQRRNEVNNEISGMVQDAQSNHIDPKQYLENEGTLGKIATAIGLIAGGIGGGLTHQGNPALEFLNAQINRNIEAQKANMQNQHNVLGALMDQGHSLDGAMQMNQAFQQQLLASKLEQAKAMAASPQAQANLDAAAGQLKMNAAATLNNYAMTRSLMQGGQGQSGDPASRIMVLQKLGAIPPETAQKALQELGSLQNNATQTQNIMAAFDKAAKENTIGNRIEHFGFAPESVNGLLTATMPALKDASGRVNEQEVAIARANAPAPGDGPTKTREKREAYQALLTGRVAHPTLDSLAPYGVRAPSVLAQRRYLPPMNGAQ